MKLWMVKFEAIIPVMAEDRQEAVSVASEFIDEEVYHLNRLTIRSAPANYRAQLSATLGGRCPVNGEQFGPTCREIVAEMERRQAIEERYQLKLFE